MSKSNESHSHLASEKIVQSSDERDFNSRPLLRRTKEGIQYNVEGPIKYIACHPDTSYHGVFNVMLRELNLKPPRMILSLLSDARPLSCADHKTQTELAVSVVQVAKTVYTWIVTNGLEKGLTRLIGQTLAQEKEWEKTLQMDDINKTFSYIDRCVLLGVTDKEQYLPNPMLNRHTRTEPEEKTSRIFVTSDRRAQNLWQAQPASDQSKDEDAIDQNHTHFLMVNSAFETYEQSSPSTSSPTDRASNAMATNATKKELKTTEQKFALNLLVELRNMSAWINQEEMQKVESTFIPFIGILVQGDIHTAYTCVNYLIEKVPILVIKGTGGCADLIAYAFNQLKCRFNMQTSTAVNLRREFITTTLAPELRSRISGPGNKTAAYVCLVLQCALLAYQSEVCYLTVLCANANDRPLQYLPEHLLERYLESRSATVLGQRKSMEEELRLALHWNSCRIAYQLLRNCISKYQIKQMSDVLLCALQMRGRQKFVQLLLRNSFCVRHILVIDQIKSLMGVALKSSQFRMIYCQNMLGLELSQNVLLIESMSNKKFVTFVNRLMHMTIELPEFFSLDDLTTQCDTAQCCLEQKGLLFLSVWAVCTGRNDLVHAFWPFSTYPLQILLFVAHTLQEMSSSVSDLATREKLNKQFDQIVALAVDLLDDCSNESQDFATKALNFPCVHFNRFTPIEIAAKLTNYDFVTHPSSQKLLEQRLMFGMHLSGSQFGELIDGIKLLLCVFFIYPIKYWVDAKQKPFPRVFFVSDQLSFDLKGDLETTSIYQRWIALTQTPATKYWLSQLFYVIFLVSFTFVVIRPLHSSLWLDICVFVTLLIDHCENARCLFEMRKSLLRPSWKDWMEQLLMIAFVCFFLFHCFLPTVQANRSYSFKYHLRMLCVSTLIYHYMKFMGIFMPMYSKLGPLFYQIKLLSLEDLFLFMILCWPFVVGFGVIIEVALYPDRESWHGNSLREMLHRSILTVFQSPYDEVREDKRGCDQHHSEPFVNSSFCRISDYDDYDCNNRGVFSNVFFLSYGLLLKIVLLALLYALFNTSMINLKWITIWRFQRFELVRHFELRYVLPPPLTPIAYLVVLIRCLVNRLTKKDIQDGRPNKCNSCTIQADIYFWNCVCRKTLKKLEAREQGKEKIK